MIDFKQLEEVAGEHGFSRVGISSPWVEKFFVERLEYWMSMGYHEGLSWFEKGAASRMDPVSALPWAKSVAVFIDNYFNPDPVLSDVENGVVFPKVSRYARGVDYHKFIRRRVEKVLEVLRAKTPGLQWKICVDTSPFMEKVYAVQAGLGWYGKNSLVIFPDIGSFCFIGIVFLNQEVKGYSVSRIVDECGECGKCIEACPSGAIVEPYFLRIERCISFLTVENKRKFSDLEERIVAQAGYVFGCDICQEVCPWNRKWVKTTQNVEYFEKAKELFKNLEDWVGISTQEFSALARGSVLKRAGYEGFLRNVKALKKWC